MEADILTKNASVNAQIIKNHKTKDLNNRIFHLFNQNNRFRHFSPLALKI